MAFNTVNLDAMIMRSDFANDDSKAATQTSDNFEKIALKDLVGDGAWLPKLLRKPDFQRETTQWKPLQIAMLVESFLNGELIPAVILWKSDTHVFVIDGGHRLSALLAWAQDDYGDGPRSLTFFKGEIPQAQRSLARKTRTELILRAGTFQHFQAKLNAKEDDEAPDPRIMNFATRGLQVQWIVGDADKAESSFFKINTQGSVLDPVESRILKNRRKAPAIAARSVVRAATGHKYWSKFRDDIQDQISVKAKEIHKSLFSPEVTSPIKTIDLPLGGTTSVTDALDLLITLAQLADREARPIEDFQDDETGERTIEVLQELEQVVARMIGNKPKSLGLHPFVYFYTAKGRHYPPLMLAMFGLLSSKLRNNDKNWFKAFTDRRQTVERLLIEHKGIITLLISALGSKVRVDGGVKILNYIIETAGSEETEITPNAFAEILGLESRLYTIQSKPGADFSDDAKSSAFLREAFKQALTCPLCGGYLDPTKSASYDHVQRKKDGGTGEEKNCQITHPYCNSLKG
ncbi:HNH endonuclease [Sphingomonas sp. G124]|uniref:HNH endonuclease n=1 Tax=Sphingomonas cremea TaxID=2904799 RepID=A0A9X1QM15_9SPHN|nr:DUF262 domain-containing protein [Sphingomonas cremea]MCF2515865.1 HNH endonuclease [Sphingomonas cremea]